MKLTDEQIERIAEEAVTRLFRNGFNEVGSRLVIMERSGGRSNSSERDLGGWCREAVRRQIMEAAMEVRRAAL